MPNPRKVAGSVVKATEQAVSAAAEAALSTLAGRDDAPAVPGRSGARAAQLRGADRAAGPAAAQARPGRPRPAYGDRRRDRRRADRRGPAGLVPDDVPGSAAARHRPLAEGGGARPDPAAGPPPAREDHALRPRAHPRACGARTRSGRARRLRRLRQRRRDLPVGVPRRGRLDPGVRAGSRPCWAHVGRPTRCGTPAASRRSSTRPKAPSTWSATTSRCSSSRTASSSPTSSTPASRTRTARSRRRRAPTTRSGTSSRCTPRRSTTRSGTCPTAASRAPTGPWRASGCTPSGC